MAEDLSSNTAPIYTPTQNTENSWQIENLIRLAWYRTKDRFISYFLAVILSILISVGIIIACIILAAILIAVSTALSFANLGLVSVLFVIAVSLLGYLVLLYVGSFISLLITQVIIQDVKRGVMETFREVRPLVWDYVWFNFLLSLFFIGLLFWGLISLFAVLIVWSLWASFATFVFLEKRQKGLSNLWISRDLVRQRFWGILWRLLLLNVAAFIISSLLAGSENSVLEFGSILVSLVTQPFLLSFSYEMYRQIPQPAEVKRPTLWIILSAIGWVLLILMIIGLGSTVYKLLKNYSPQELMNLYKPLQNEEDIERFLPNSNLVPQNFDLGPTNSL